MLKHKFILFAAILLTSLSSCGIFKKGCGCPPVSKIKTMEKEGQANSRLA